MLQDRYGRLIIVGIFVLIGIVMIIAPGINSKNGVQENDQLNFTNIAEKKDIQNTQDKSPENVNLSPDMPFENISPASLEEQMLDAWGLRKSSNVSFENEKQDINEIVVNPQDDIKKNEVINSEKSFDQSLQQKKNIIKVNGKCFAPPKINSSMLKSECENTGNTYGIQGCMEDSAKQDGWAGAVRACGGVEKMPDMDDLLAISRILYGSEILKIDEQDRVHYNAYNVYSAENRECDSFEFRNLSYNSKLAEELGFRELSGYEIWGKTEISPKYGLSLYYGETFVKYTSCSNKDVPTNFTLCQIPCQ